MNSNEENIITCPISLDTATGKVCYHWFLKVTDDPQKISYLTNARVAPLISGERAFYAVHKAIEQAEHNVDIVCWGFQPSMYFIRNKSDNESDDNESERESDNGSDNPSIGDLLIKKSLQGVKVSIVCWSMKFDLQKINEDNMRQNIPERNPKNIDAITDESTIEQYHYNRLWYKVVRKGLYLKKTSYRYKSISKYVANITDQYYKKNYENLLILLQIPVAKRNIIFTTRSSGHHLNLDSSNYTFKQRLALYLITSHHQKIVLIDIHHPKQAFGFVMEHNIQDNYWDNDHYKLAKLAPYEGKCVTVPWQDTSALVTGEILYDLYLNHIDAIVESRANIPFKKMQRNVFNYDVSERANKVLPTNCKLSIKVAAQILRTYPDKKETNIKKLYLKNLPQAEAYIYTENQYFRFKELVDTIKTARKKMKLNDMPWLYWFVVTNSEEASISVAMKSTFQMMNALGRGDALPELKRKELYKEQRQRKAEIKDKEHQLRRTQNEEQQQKLQAEINQLKKEYGEKEKLKDKTKVQENPQILQEELDEYKMKVHICTLVSPNTYTYRPQNKKRDYDIDKTSIWQEVYVHSKVTIVDDTFLTMGSANLNLRSMGHDSELNLVIDGSRKSFIGLNLRRELWNKNVMPFKHSERVNTEIDEDLLLNDNATIVNPAKLKKIFNSWKQILDENQELEAEHQRPQQALRRFLNSRASTGYMNID